MHRGATPATAYLTAGSNFPGTGPGSVPTVTKVEVDIIVSEGPPFLQIIQKAQEFLADAIVMGRVGGGGRMEKLLFGSTAEKVLRASSRPVIVLPIESPAE